MNIVSFGLAAALAVMASSASATSLNNPYAVNPVGPGSIGYTSFTVTQAGYFDLYTRSAMIDPVLWLFRDGNRNGVLDEADVDPFMVLNDDGCRGHAGQCGLAGAAFNALIDDIELRSGTYILAVGDYWFSEREARHGLETPHELYGFVRTIISTDFLSAGHRPGVAQLSAIPLPATLPLLGAAFGAAIGAIGLARTRRKRV